MALARLRVSVATPDSPLPRRGSGPRRRAATTSTRGLSQWLSRVAPASARGDVSVALVSDRRMRALNRQFRGKDQATDVLSFPATGRASGKPKGLPTPAPADFLGDIVIATGVATKQARQAGHTATIEVRVLALHGLLHLLGYDHDGKADQGRMARAERRLRKKGGLQEGLVERSRR
jgi:probable rRNA maturation factor